MSVQAITCAMALRGVSPSEKLLLLALANYADEHMRCYPSQRRLAGDTCLSDRTIRSLLSTLEQRRMISRQERLRDDGSRSTDVITLHFAGVLTLDVDAQISGGAEMVSGGVRKQLPGGAEMVSGLTTFEPSLEPSKEPVGFDEWWEAYPKKVAKGAARRAFSAALKKTTGAALLAALTSYRFAQENRFIAHPATWLNGECWLDDPEPTLAVATEQDPWKARLLNWRVNRYWNSDWGPKPGEGGYRGPAEPEARAA